MPKEKPSFYAVLPASVRYDSELSSSEKIFYAEITAMSQKEGYCWASNSYFAELYDVANSTISGWVSSLKEKQHIVVEYEKEGKQVKQRNIYPIQKISIPYSENSKGGIQKTERGYSEKGKENTTSNNTTSNNNIPDSVIEDVYQLYPRKVGKKKALKKIRKVLEDDIDAEELKEKVKLYAKSVKDKDKQYIPYPSTWFNQGRYLDDPEEWVQYKNDDQQNENLQPEYMQTI